MLIIVLLLVSLLIISVYAVQTEKISKISPDIGSKDKADTQVVQKAPSTSSLYVNSRTGNDSSGTGSSTNPFKTITHAMDTARSGTTIYVEGADPYDAANGEVFPIRMKSGVKLMKKPTASSGSLVPVTEPPVITGGAHYDIPDSPMGRYVTILGADGATISGFHLRAIDTPGSSDDGTSILCDSTSPTITKNSFSGYGRAGITTLGNAHPTITDNTFTGELAWGITAYGESYPAVTENSFSGNGGMDCTDHSHPTVDKNTFSCENTGFSTKGSSDATFTNNVVKGNGESGIVTRQDSNPVIQGNKITQNPVGILTQPGARTNPDIGGGGRSTGGNIFDNYDWNIQHRAPTNISAVDNSWGSACCEEIDKKIYDGKDDALSGMVDVGTCVICRATLPLRPAGNGS
jgi:parallel beta-helix repeat protein